jgi:hypothetical protein
MSFANYVLEIDQKSFERYPFPSISALCIIRFCHNPSLSLVTKARVYKGADQEGSPGVTSHAPMNVGKCEGMNPTLPNELPLWELESQWTLESSKNNFKGLNSLD